MQAAIIQGFSRWFTRNTERRVEVACPVLAPSVRKKIFHIIEVLTADNVKARQLGADGLWHPRQTGGAPCCSQEIFQEEAAQEERSIPERSSKPRRKDPVWKRLLGHLGKHG